MKSGALWVHCWVLALADFGCDPLSIRSIMHAVPGMLTIGRIAYRREGSAWSAQRGRSITYDCLVLNVWFNRVVCIVLISTTVTTFRHIQRFQEILYGSAFSSPAFAVDPCDGRKRTWSGDHEVINWHITYQYLALLKVLHEYNWYEYNSKCCDEYVCRSVCLSVCPRWYLRNHMHDLYHFLCMLPMSAARFSSGMLTIVRIANRREGVTGVYSAGEV